MATVPTAAELRYERDHFDDSEVPSLLVSNIICLTLATIAVALRFLCRRMSKIKYQYDDWFIVAGLILSTAVIACQFTGVRYGAGRHTIVMTSTTTSLKGFTRTLLAVEVIYQAATFCIKASILYLYHRVFFVSRRFTITLWIVGVFVCLYSCVQGLGALIECVPLNSNWDPMVKRHCFPITLSVTIFACCNVLTDFIILVLPMPLLWKLNQPLEQKIKIMGMFLLGGFVCFASIYRAIIIHNLTRIDPSWKDIPSQVWTAIEMGMGVVSVCLPTYRPIFSLMIPKFKTKFASFGSGWDSGQTLQVEGGEMRERETSEPSAIDVEESTSELSPQGPRSRPSQSLEFAHIGIFGNELDLESGSEARAAVVVEET